MKAVIACLLLILVSATNAQIKSVIGKLGQATEKCDIYEKPDPSSHVYYHIAALEYVVVHKDHPDGWRKVMLQNGQFGFVEESHLLMLPYEVTAVKGKGDGGLQVYSNEIYEAFQGNELSAESIIKGKRITIKGIVTRVAKTGKNELAVLLSGGDGTICGCAFNFPLSKRKVLENLKIGDYATISGIYSEVYMGSIYFKSPVLIGTNAR
jgi:hypothetical protein